MRLLASSAGSRVRTPAAPQRDFNVPFGVSVAFERRRAGKRRMCERPGRTGPGGVGIQAAAQPADSASACSSTVRVADSCLSGG